MGVIIVTTLVNELIFPALFIATLVKELHFPAFPIASN